MAFFTVLSPNGEHVEPLTETRFLRGAQYTDAQGVCEFNTIFPGWYEPRTPHIHFKVLIDSKEQLTSQFYFEPDFCEKVYTSIVPYTKYGNSPFNFQNDIVLQGSHDLDGLMLHPVWNEHSALEAFAKVGLRRAG